MRKRLIPANPAAILIAAAGIMMATLLMAGLGPGRSSKVAGAVAAVHAPVQATTPATTPVLGFRAETRDGDLWLTWNRDAAAVKNATSAILTIEDGHSPREILLSQAVVQGGAFRVSSKSEDVTASLTIFGSGTTTREWAIAVLAPNPPAAFAASRKAVSDLPEKLPPTAPTDGKPAASAPDPTAPLISPVAPLASNPPVVESLSPATQLPASELVAEPRGIDILVTIDDAGAVVAAEITTRNGVDQRFADAALNLARTWRFEPTRLPGFRERTLHLQKPTYY